MLAIARSALARATLAGVVLVALAAQPALAEPRRYSLDADHFAIAFKARHLGLSDVLGQFLKASGSFVYDEEARTVEDISVEIDTASVFSNHEARDGHLRGRSDGESEGDGVRASGRTDVAAENEDRKTAREGSGSARSATG